MSKAESLSDLGTLTGIVTFTSGVPSVTTFKTINGSSIIGSGDMTITAGAAITDDTVTNATRYLMFDDVTTGNATTVGVSSTKLTFNPSTGNLYAVNFVSTSDERLKKDIAPIVDALSLVNQLNGKTFTLIDSDQQSMGVIAQELETVIPYLVDTNVDTGLKSVNYPALTGLLIEAIKELSSKLGA